MTIDTNVKYDETGQYGMWIDHALIGYARTRDEGEATVKEVVEAMQGILLADEVMGIAHILLNDPPPPPEPEDNPDIDSTPETEGPSPLCGACGEAHHVQSCPELRAALFAPDACPSCGDPSIGVCVACHEAEGLSLTDYSGWGEPPYALLAA